MRDIAAVTTIQDLLGQRAQLESTIANTRERQEKLRAEGGTPPQLREFAEGISIAKTTLASLTDELAQAVDAAHLHIRNAASEILLQHKDNLRAKLLALDLSQLWVDNNLDEIVSISNAAGKIRQVLFASPRQSSELDLIQFAQHTIELHAKWLALVEENQPASA